MKQNLLKLLAILALATTALAEGKVGFAADDTAASVLKRQAGQRVELRLKSGEKIAGKVEAVGSKAESNASAMLASIIELSSTTTR